MRTVSFFGPMLGGTGGGDTGADNGREAAGGFGGGKKLLEEISSEADCGDDETCEPPASRVGNWIRTVSRGFTVDSGGLVIGGCGSSMRTVSFFGWSGSAMGAGEIDQRIDDLSLSNLGTHKKCD